LLRAAFDATKARFKAALEELRAEGEVEVDFQLLDDRSFTCAVEAENRPVVRCKIWLGTHGFGAERICFFEGPSLTGNALNEMIGVRDDSTKDEPRFSALMAMAHDAPRDLDTENLTESQIAEYLWHRFLWRLNAR
jgi:hypothetical protein